MSRALSASSVISGVGILSKNGLGTLVLGGTNTFGPTVADNLTQIIINAGVLSVSADANMGNPDDTIFGGIVVRPGGIRLNGGQLLATDTFSTNRTIDMNAAGSINVAAGKTLTIQGVVSANGLLTVNGQGTLILNGAATNGSAAWPACE
jgi:fibronectin-binding autotransporter adhesin